MAILIMLLMALFLGIGLWRSQAFYLTITFMLFFIMLTGGQPSAIRAGIMGGLFLLGSYIGRMNISLRALVFAGTIMLAFNPLLLLGDVGFQLSFLAVFGIISFAPFLNHVFGKLPNPWHLREILAMTIAAQVFTLPILIYNFGQVSLVSVLTNILIVPILPFLIALGFLFLLVGTIFSSFAFLLSLPVSFLLHYVTSVVNLFSQFPFAALQIEHLSPIWLMLFYIPLGIFLWKFRSRQEFPHLYR